MEQISSAGLRAMRIVILGLARQGTALARFCAQAGNRVTVSDSAQPEQLQAELAALSDLPVELALGGHPESLLDDCDLLCLSGGVSPQIPIVQAAIRRGIPLTNDSLLTLQQAPCPVIAITGSSGKTTTTTLVGEILRRWSAGSDRTVHVGGNIGLPLLDRLPQIGAHDLIVLELSSFQLELFDPAIAWGSFTDLGPDIAVILNLTPNHLDRHLSMRAYADAKLNLLGHLKPESQLIVSADDPVTARLLEQNSGATPPQMPAGWQLSERLTEVCAQLTADRVRRTPFSLRRELTSGAWLARDQLVYAGRPFCHRAEVQLRGEHNLSNLLAAAAISGAAGASIAAMGQVAREFRGVPHRLEVVRVQDGVTWINDSIATAPERAIAGLRCFPAGEQTLVLLAGGRDKQLPWNAFVDEVLTRVNFLICFGEAGPMIVETVQERAQLCRRQAPNCALVTRLDEAVELAARVVHPNSVVLLSPGGTSYDAYKNFEARGEHFRTLVARVIEDL